ncbi:dihydrolipoamide acetyltransferase family protein, partial [Nonomuraea lactucae]|uniref:dihydrolipoamide acetyltransferase family protein n=1 Tax=Nonomuraea lactucae TaxID=2249762 RepID=UPI0013B35B32
TPASSTPAPRTPAPRASASRTSEGSTAPGTPAPESRAPAPPRALSPSEAPATAGPGAVRPVISPVVRRLARDHGIDLAALPGSGPQGLVTRKDVEAAIRAWDAPQADPTHTDATHTDATHTDATRRDATHADATRTGAALGRPGGGRIPLRGLRRVVADRMARSRREIPEATVWVDVDATALLEVKAAIDGVSLLGLLARYCVLGLRRHPLLNARVDAERDEIVLNEDVNLGFAAQTPRGLVVPVAHGAHAMSARALTAEVGRLATAAREGVLTPGELAGGTFTLNNYGRYGVDGSAAIINYPEVAILGIGRIIDRPWVVDGTLAVRKVAELTLAFDHRVCDGEDAGGFLRYVADCVENPLNALGDL